MRQVVIVILGILLLCFPSYSQADERQEKQSWKELNHTSDQILQLVKQEKYEEAKQVLDYFSKSFLEMDFKQEEVTMSALRTVTIAFEHAQEAVTAVDLSHPERIHQVTAFRLAVDALSSEYHPLWIHTEKTVMNVFTEMKQAVEQGENQAFQHRINDFLRHYQMIKPALLIDLEPQQLQRIESQVTYLERLRTEYETEKAIRHLELMETEFKTMYERVKEDSADPSLLWVMFTIGGMIVLSLSYVGYRKYRAEKGKVRAKE
ncbi:sporulation protein YpjB [Halalkalibacter urbisdiaboli]|uniref:sporulation protein YpjB n=1 Tax=Halalkalibacter urbisdiaboli TaxID=1960589 RepID=UPI000B448925|nr:sporulation protein YpjB [Halalkalibacter urbisdiaboli]